MTADPPAAAPSGKPSTAQVADGVPVLVVDDDPTVRRSLVSLLELEGYAPTQAVSGEAAIAAMDEREYLLVLTDVYLPGMSGVDVLREIKRRAPETAVILLTGFARVEDAVAGMRTGAYDYVTKPVDDHALLRTMRHALEEARLRRENTRLRRQLGDGLAFGRLVGRDAEMRQIFEMAETVGETDATVLITGESGTGKSSIARAIHCHSPRANGPLIEVSCGALAPTLLESELFGHVRGAFTGAVTAKAGKFELAKGGTILLDEIDTLDLALQVKLLRVLQEKRFEPVGGTETRQTNVRIIAAANQDLAECMRAGTFRQDLYYRLNVISFAVPPLRNRIGDLPALAHHFLKACCERHGKQITTIDDEALNCLVSYHWPGNIRELENVVERGVILSRSDQFTIKELPPNVVQPGLSPMASAPVRPLRLALDDAEHGILLRALEAHNWNRIATAAALDINRTTLFHKMKKLGLLQPGPQHVQP